MKILILKENIVRALSIVGKGISLRPQLPILSHILLRGAKNQLEFLSTNLELGIIYQTSAKIEKEGEVAIPGKLLTEFINSLGADKLEITATDKNLEVKTDTTRASFAIGNPADFPTFPQPLSFDRKLPFAKVKDSIIRTAFAASIDEGRPILTGVRTKIDDGILSMSATDGYRLSKEEVAIPSKNELLDVVLPASSLFEVVRIAQELKAADLDISIIENKNQVVFSMPDTKIYSRLIDGEFPNVEKIIPDSFKTRVILDKELFTQAVKTTSIFARGAANIIKMKIEKEGLRLSANTPQVGEESDYVEAKVEGEESEVAFNFRFLLDLLSNFPEKELVFESSGPLSPGVFKPKSDKISFLHIIMPVRVQG
ncbi:MAG: polymerase III subunit beta, DNA polymerase III subunit beta protein [Candidatus Gottesmanbacteria bacterium GW2011_GWA2_43_14]|uniref:Beta sliding clamp n=1 Tax=Candidatus Gottesmanbacteria bacterium GW2011_GWA2_43_14 TaxID=1618443 RepID=A0A0G1DK02_9BACT|nr:MAG: polymerase III subunit beta, DNA polymerase III subunit beta protein [Candidatus Gottesmanbacteria bacterium GW2011_GWA2_43_14]